MKISTNRSDLELDLAKALSRHIGYTTAAYDLERIVSILDLFAGVPSVYEPEIVEFLRNDTQEQEKGASDRYLSEVINFCVSMDLIEVVGSRSAQLTKYTATSIGRSLLAARSIGNDEFYQFALTKSVLLADADSIFCILKYYHASEIIKLDQFYKEFHNTLRHRRLDWLLTAFPEPTLVSRIADHLSWLKRTRTADRSLTVEEISNHTARHHSTPRRGWIDFLGMRNPETGSLTEFGETIRRSLLNEGAYFWLGPHSKTQDGLRIPESYQASGPFRDTLSFSHTNVQPSPQQIGRMTVDLLEVMERGFSHARLAHARQAPLDFPIEYIYFRSYKDKVEYNWREVLDDVFSANRKRVQRLSARVGEIGFYRIV